MNRTAFYRVLDANFNRLREGVRVLEEVQRLVINHRSPAGQLKQLRHNIAGIYRKFSQGRLIASRDSDGDVGRFIAVRGETRRRTLDELVTANFKRCQEAARVIEEFAKVADSRISPAAKELRFCLYSIEKKFLSVYHKKKERVNGRRA